MKTFARFENRTPQESQTVYVSVDDIETITDHGENRSEIRMKNGSYVIVEMSANLAYREIVNA